MTPSYLIAATRSRATWSPYCWDQTCWVIVPPGLRRAVALVTNRPVAADRFTLRLFPVPEPTRSVVVVRGDRAAVAFVTKRPVRALRLTDRAMVSSSGTLIRGGGRPFAGACGSIRIASTTNHGTCGSDLELLGGPAATGPPFCVSDKPTLTAYAYPIFTARVKTSRSGRSIAS